MSIMIGNKHLSLSVHGYLLVFSSLVLSLIGLIMVYSITGGQILSHHFHSTHYYYAINTEKYLYTQGSYILFGIVATMVVSLFNPAFFKKIMVFAVIGSIFLLLMVLIIGVSINGARRWFIIGGFSIQPMEFSKIGLVLYLAVILEKRINQIQDFKRGFLQPIIIIGIFILLLLVEPDLGSSVLFITVATMLLFVAGSRLYYFALAGSIAIPILWYYVAAGWRLNKRIIPFLHPEQFSQGAAYQIIRSLDAFGSGGLWGWGLGDGPYKMDFLPGAHTDYIAAMLGQELGFVGVIIVLGLYSIFLYAGISIALRYKHNIFRFIMALGLTLMLFFQAVINLSVVMNLIPSKGITLPFMSFGGSSMLISFIITGILISIDIHPIKETERKSSTKKQSKIVVIGKHSNQY